MTTSKNQECYEQMSQLFREQLEILYKLSRAKLSGRFQDGWVVLGASCNSAAAISVLLPQPTIFANEMLMMARSLQEKLINYCYFTVCNEEEAQRFLAYPLYRLYHNSKRTRKAGDEVLNLQYSGADQLKDDDAISEALALFADKKGFEGRQNWTKKTFNQRLDVITTNTKMSAPLLLMGSMLIYPDASEILHGSPYGVVALSGIFDVGGKSPKNLSQAHDNIYSKLVMVIYLVTELMGETARYIYENNKLANDIRPQLADIREKAIKVLEQKVS